MKLCGVCITTNNAPRLAAFYEIVFQEAPFVESSHYDFGKDAQLSVYDPKDADFCHGKNLSLMYYVPDLMAEYHRLLEEIPAIEITSPPERRPWGAFSFWFLDPDGNTVSFIEETIEG